MTPIARALDMIKLQIPIQLLRSGFRESENYLSWRQTIKPVSLDELIKEQVIKTRVLVDTNLVGGTETFIDLSNLNYKTYDDWVVVYYIPADKRANRDIISVLSVGYYKNIANLTTTGLNYSLPQYSQDTVLAGNAVMNSYSAQPIMSNAELSLIGTNTVMIRQQYLNSNINFLRCIVGYDNELTDLKVRTIPTFAKLCVLATKSYIYNKLIIAVGQGQLDGGQELGKFSEILESYSEAEEQYEDYLTNTFQAVLYMNDDLKYQRYLKMITGPYK